MSLRWTSYFAPKPPKGDSKCKTADFCVKSHFAWRKPAATKFLCVKTVSNKVVGHSLAISIIVKMTGGGRPLLRENLANTDPPPLHNADFRSIFARSVSTVTASEKSSINTNRKSTTRFPISLKRIVCVDPKPRSKTQKMSKFKQSAITSKRYEIGCQLLLITNKMSHTVFRLLTTSVILNDLERRNSPYFVLFHRIR